VVRRRIPTRFVNGKSQKFDGRPSLWTKKARDGSVSGENLRGDYATRSSLEIYTDDPEAVQPFYQDVFGWKFKKFEGGPVEYWLVTTGEDKDPGINGG
jgi:hypothetical protein